MHVLTFCIGSFVSHFSSRNYIQLIANSMYTWQKPESHYNEKEQAKVKYKQGLSL